MPENNLEQIRAKLAMLEDSVIFGLFERARFKRNMRIYIPGGVEVPSRIYFPDGNGIRFEGSFFDFMLLETEGLHSAAGRYEHPEEFPFSDRLPKMLVGREKSTTNKLINKNKEIRTMYFAFLPQLCIEGDDNEYGSTAICDIRCLQDISRRVHLGVQAAEAKFQQDPEGYNLLLKAEFTGGLRGKLRSPEVEKAILERVKQKGERYNINPNLVSEFYEKHIIPMTIDVQVEYFINKREEK